MYLFAGKQQMKNKKLSASISEISHSWCYVEHSMINFYVPGVTISH